MTGEPVEEIKLLPMNRQSRKWANRYGHVVYMMKREGERFKVKSLDGRTSRWFGPRDATWTQG